MKYFSFNATLSVSLSSSYYLNFILIVMSKKITFFLLLFLTSVSYSQTTVSDLDKNLSVKYSASEISAMKETNKEMYNLYAKSFSVGIMIFPNDDAFKAKGNTYDQLNITVQEGEKFNYLAYNLELKNVSQYYVINGGKSILLIRGSDTLKKMK